MCDLIIGTVSCAKLSLHCSVIYTIRWPLSVILGVSRKGMLISRLEIIVLFYIVYVQIVEMLKSGHSLQFVYWQKRHRSARKSRYSFLWKNCIKIGSGKNLPKQGPEVIKLFSCSIQLSMKFSLLINMKMPTTVGIFIFISKENSQLNWVRKQLYLSVICCLLAG